MSSRIVYLNGRFLPIEEAHISVMDRGFLFGDGVYEVIPLFHGKLFKAREHLQRFKKSLAAIRLEVVFEEKDFLDILAQLLQRNPHQGENRSVYLQITRGVAESREHIFPHNASPTIFIQCTPINPPSVEALSGGAKALILPDIRWAQCHIKAITLLPNVLIAQQAFDVDAKEAILIRNGMAIEGIASNLFMVKNGTLITPPANGSILRGVTRDVILELAHQHHVPFIESDIPQDTLKEADEIWMSGSLKEILPIVQIDNIPVADGKVGPMWRQFFKYYQEAKLNN